MLIMKKCILFGLLLVIASTMIAGCGPTATQPSAPAGANDAGPKITVMEPWSRSSPMVEGNGAVYMTLINEGSSPDKLVSAASDVAEVVELHVSKMDGDVMKMSPVAAIEVPGGGSTKLEPGGLHVMLINLKRELVPGEKVNLTLNFERSGSLSVEAEIRADGEMMEQGQMEHEGQ